MSKELLHTPEGVRDVYGKECARKLTIENKINKIIDTIICINNKENKFLNHALKNQEVESKEFDKIAKGAIKTKTLIKTYLKE